jgi:ankyrin repeat protein
MSDIEHRSIEEELQDTGMHEECRYQCRSSIILKYIELYPESLATIDKDRNLPLHCLLGNYNQISTIEDALMMIDKHPAAVERENDDGFLPLHIEYCNQRRSAIIAKCIELYPESLAMPNPSGRLPWEWVLEDESIPMEQVIKMFEKYPAALHHQSKFGFLPLHIECNNRCRSAIMLKCIELYPQSVACVDTQGYVPIQILLKKSSSVSEAALMMLMQKYPATLKRKNKDGSLPLHLECMNKCRPSIILKCIELYPDALSKADKENALPLHSLLWKG